MACDAFFIMKATREDSVESEEEIDYTDEQVLAVKRVENAQDYYSMLGITKDFDVADLKKSYRRLALVLHPDKNHAPGASDAFKAVSKAFATLNDAEIRAKYDQYGPDFESGQNKSAPSQEDLIAHFEKAFGSTISPEEVFNLFYGTHAGSKEAFEHSGSAKFFYRTPGDSSFLVDIQRLLPLVILLCMSILSSLFGEWYVRTTWRLSADSTYTVLRHTVSTEYNVPYYVAESFESDYPTLVDALNLEKEVEKIFVADRRRACDRDTAARDSRLAAAQRAYFPDQFEIHHLKTKRLKSCSDLATLKKNTVRVDPVMTTRKMPTETPGMPSPDSIPDETSSEASLEDDLNKNNDNGDDSDDIDGGGDAEYNGDVADDSIEESLEEEEEAPF